MTKLTQDQKEDLAELVQSPIWETVLAVCQMAVENHETRVLTSDMKASDRELIMNKARLEGAQDVRRSFHAVRELIGGAKKKDKHGLRV